MSALLGATVEVQRLHVLSRDCALPGDMTGFGVYTMCRRLARRFVRPVLS